LIYKLHNKPLPKKDEHFCITTGLIELVKNLERESSKK
jgi:hypothetical protein